jgi:CheY-like chemotaxis protein
MPKVLDVEDEPSQAEILTILLGIEGFEVSVAVDGKDALAQLDQVQPDLIVTDYMMPLMNGGEMVARIRAMPAYGKVPIVMTSATDMRQIEKYSAHYDAFFRKPYLWNDLFAAIRKLLP